MRGAARGAGVVRGGARLELGIERIIVPAIWVCWRRRASAAPIEHEVSGAFLTPVECRADLCGRHCRA
jgi:hypothetical protein